MRIHFCNLYICLWTLTEQHLDVSIITAMSDNRACTYSENSIFGCTGRLLWLSTFNPRAFKNKSIDWHSVQIKIIKNHQTSHLCISVQRRYWGLVELSANKKATITRLWRSPNIAKRLFSIRGQICGSLEADRERRFSFRAEETDATDAEYNHVCIWHLDWDVLCTRRT